MSGLVSLGRRPRSAGHTEPQSGGACYETAFTPAQVLKNGFPSDIKSEFLAKY